MANERENEPLPLWQVLREEYGELRRDWQGELADARFEDPAVADSEKLELLFAIVHKRSSAGEEAGGQGTGRGPLAALCFSGGGIRSATFNLGVLQGMARIGLLGRFDYLSSVSGGGYISSWLARWICKAGGAQPVVAQLTQEPRDPEKPEPVEITHLRQYSNYLTPRLGALSADTWTVVAIVIRNLILNWLVLLPILAGVLLIPLLAVARLPRDWELPTAWLVGTALALELVALFFMSLLRAARGGKEEQPQGKKQESSPPWWTRAFLPLGLLPLLAAIPLVLQAVYQVAAWPPPTGDPSFLSSPPRLLGYSAAFAIGVPLIALIASVLLQKPLLGRRVSSLAWDSVALVVAGGVETLIFAGILAGWVPGLVACHDPLFAVLGPGLVLGPMLLGRTLFIGVSSLAETSRASRDSDADQLAAARYETTPLPANLAAGRADAGRAAGGRDDAARKPQHRAAGRLYASRDEISWSSENRDADREWWSRWSAWELIVGVVWIAGSALVLFAPTLLHTGTRALAAWVAAGGLGATAALLGKSASTSAKEDSGKKSPVQSAVMTLAAPLFAIALVLALSWGSQRLLEKVAPGAREKPGQAAADCNVAPAGDAAPASGRSQLAAGTAGSKQQPDDAAAGTKARAKGSLHLELTGPATSGGPVPQSFRADVQLEEMAAKQPFWRYDPPYHGRVGVVALAIAALILFGVACGWPFNVNRFSLQAAYRNRLIRAYLGASNKLRNPNLFTGFDPADNIRLHELHDNRPLPVFNMTLNLVHGDNLAWQERKAESFTASPFHCGAFNTGYRPSRSYGGPGGISLGTAVATSGAAANPNMGFNSSPVISFIMTLFNVRLGIWLGNPRHCSRTWRRSGPRSSARIIFAEAFGLTDLDHPYVSLSDGGHFEDLGLYEMVRRRCHTIVVSDAGADPSYAFTDLANAIRKIRIDQGIEIEFKERVRIYPKATAAGKPPKEDGKYCAVAIIHYDRVDGEGVPPGRLIYVKPAICEQPSPPPVDVGNYAVTSATFPQESTADQWFSETQFESYRALGEVAIETIAGAGGGGGGAPVGGFDQLVAQVDSYIKAEKAAGEAKPA